MFISFLRTLILYPLLLLVVRLMGKRQDVYKRQVNGGAFMRRSS